ncbi:uncharacterized protein LOC135923635 [Gordionus sp. m RMFG-2023]|uniref:uncharacterized protein LOC135923635 n=1 Tax=Gordionus sp. m RMFG-2023 TaxID=3053472 RepID=UPI0031FCBA26
MNMAKEHFEHVWVNKNDELFNDCYLTFDLNTLYNYCLACGITTETLDFPVGEIDERKVVDDNHSSLVTKGSYSYEAFDRIYSGIQNAREVLNVLKSNLSTEDELDLNSFQIVYNEIINKQLWSSEDVKKLDILFLLKNIIVRENSALMYASVKKIFGDMTKEILEYFTEIIREIYTQSQQIKDINITRARIRGLIIYLATILVDRTSKNVSLLLGLCEILRANIIPRETNQDIKDQLSNIVNALELSAKKTAKNTSVSDGDTKIAAKSLKSKSTHLLDDPKSYSEDDDLEITNLNMRLLKCKNPWTVKDILLTLSNDYQKEPTFLSRFDDMLPRHLLNSLVNLPTGIRRNYIHLILIKARQCQSTEKYRLAQNLIRCCETELINFQEQYSNSSQNSANKDPLYQNSSLLLKYVRWELLFCRLRIELQNRSAMANDKNSYGLINDTKAFLHNLQAFENDMNILNSEIVCAALIYLLKNEEDEYLTNFFPNPSIFYMNLASCLINLKNEFNKIDIEKKIFTLLDLSPATKIALSKFWDLVNTLFSDPSDLNKNAPSKLPSVISGGQNPNKNKCSTPPPIFSNLATHSASLKFPLDDNSLPGNGILGLGGNAQNQPTSILPLPPPPIFPHPPHHLRYLIQHQHKQNIQRIPLFNSILRIPPPMSNAIRSTPFNMGLNINSHGMDVDFKVGYINNYLSLNGDKILMDFINQLNIIQEPVYMTLIGSCLLKIYSLVKDELCFDFVFPYLQYWPSLLLFPQYKINELEDILTFCTNQALKICSNPTSSRVPWLLLRADMEYVNKNWFTAMGYYSQALFVQTNLGEPSECRKEFKIFSNDMYIRMTKCCVEMESNIEAALICQLTNPVDYARAFQVISQALATTTPDTGSYSNIHNTEYSPYTDQDVMAEDLIAGNDNGFDKNTTKPQNIYNGKQDKFCLASDSLYDMMWDMTLVEYVGSMLTSFENQFKIKRNKLLDIISDPNFNMHNARNILNVAVSYKKSKLLSFLVTKYIINN